MTPQDVVTGFIVDDGNADRSQRNTLLNPGIKIQFQAFHPNLLN